MYDVMAFYRINCSTSKLKFGKLFALCFFGVIGLHAILDFDGDFWRKEFLTKLCGA